LVLEYGFEYLKGFITQLDVFIEEKITVLTGSLNQQNAKFYLETDTVKSVEKIYAVQKPKIWYKSFGFEKTSIDNFETLITSIDEYINDRINIALTSCKKEMLEYLALGELGWIDSLEANVQRAVTSLESKTREYDDLYNSKLPIAFEKTRQLVTRQYLPNIADFVNGGIWTNNEFSGAYTTTIQRQVATGAASTPVPVRSGAATQFSLKQVMIDVLTNTQYTNNVNYRGTGDVSTNFFAHMLNPDSVFSDQPINTGIYELTKMVKKWIHSVLFTQTNFYGITNTIKTTADLDLFQRFSSLTEQDKQNVAAEFNRNKSLFFPGNPGAVADEIFLGDPQMAAVINFFGYTGATTQGTYEAISGMKSLVVVKTNNGFQYVNYRQNSNYKLQFDALKSDKTMFTPFVDKRFNQKPNDIVGVIQQYLQNTSVISNQLVNAQNYSNLIATMFFAEILNHIDDKTLENFIAVDDNARTGFATDPIGTSLLLRPVKFEIDDAKECIKFYCVMPESIINKTSFGKTKWQVNFGTNVYETMIWNYGADAISVKGFDTIKDIIKLLYVNNHFNPNVFEFVNKQIFNKLITSISSVDAKNELCSLVNNTRLEELL